MAERKRKNKNEDPSAVEQAGEGVGGIGGTLGGAALGSLAGPVGTIVGGIAGAVGGWWAGEKVGEAIEDSDRREPEYRRDYETIGSDDVDYDQARIGYRVGYVASRNPGYQDREFDQVDRDLRLGWRDDNYGYDDLRPYVQRGYEHGLRSRGTRDD